MKKLVNAKLVRGIDNVKIKVNDFQDMVVLDLSGPNRLQTVDMKIYEVVIDEWESAKEKKPVWRDEAPLELMVGLDAPMEQPVAIVPVVEALTAEALSTTSTRLKTMSHHS